MRNALLILGIIAAEFGTAQSWRPVALPTFTYIPFSAQTTIPETAEMLLSHRRVRGNFDQGVLWKLIKSAKSSSHKPENLRLAIRQGSTVILLMDHRGFIRYNHHLFVLDQQSFIKLETLLEPLVKS